MKSATRHDAPRRARDFAERFGLRVPVLMAPMAGACPPALAAAVADAGGMGAVGAVLDGPGRIGAWVHEFRAGDRTRPLQMNLWVPDPPPARDPAHEREVRAFLARFGPEVAGDAFDVAEPPSFDAQCEAMLEARPSAVSSIMGLYPPEVVARAKAAGIAWFACATTPGEALAARDAGADAIVAQGAEAGGHRGAFDAGRARDGAVGLFSLLPQVVDAVDVPVIATGGVSDARGIAAALMLGASAVQVGTGLLRTDESSAAPAWREALARGTPEGTRLTRAFSGRWGRAVANRYVEAAAGGQAPEPAPYPVQRALSAAMRAAATRDDDIERMQAWAGQSAALAGDGPAGALVSRWWDEAAALLGDAGPRS